MWDCGTGQLRGGASIMAGCGPGDEAVITALSMRAPPKPIYQQITERLERELRTGKIHRRPEIPQRSGSSSNASQPRASPWAAPCATSSSAACSTASPVPAPTCAAPITTSRAGLLFGLVIPNLGETEIFSEPICQGIAAAPDAAGHALLWSHAGQRAATREEQAVELARQSIARRRRRRHLLRAPGIQPPQRPRSTRA